MRIVTDRLVYFNKKYRSNYETNMIQMEGARQIKRAAVCFFIDINVLWLLVFSYTELMV